MTKHETTINYELYKVKAKSYYHDKWLNGFFSNFMLGGLEIIDEKAMHCKIDENTLCRNTGKKIPDMHGKKVYLYENDVCKMTWQDDCDNETNCEYVFIRYDEDLCGFVAVGERGDQIDLNGFGDNDVEGIYECIVGNVFDNADLLSGKQKEKLK